MGFSFTLRILDYLINVQFDTSIDKRKTQEEKLAELHEMLEGGMVVPMGSLEESEETIGFNLKPKVDKQ